MDNENINGISRKAFEEFNKVQMSGVINMFNYPGVGVIASRVGFLSLWNVCKDVKKYTALQDSYELAMEKGWVDVMKETDAETIKKLQDVMY